MFTADRWAKATWFSHSLLIMGSFLQLYSPPQTHTPSFLIFRYFFQDLHSAKTAISELTHRLPPRGGVPLPSLAGSNEISTFPPLPATQLCSTTAHTSWSNGERSPPCKLVWLPKNIKLVMPPLGFYMFLQGTKDTDWLEENLVKDTGLVWFNVKLELCKISAFYTCALLLQMLHFSFFLFYFSWIVFYFHLLP